MNSLAQRRFFLPLLDNCSSFSSSRYILVTYPLVAYSLHTSRCLKLSSRCMPSMCIRILSDFPMPEQTFAEQALAGHTCASTCRELCYILLPLTILTHILSAGPHEKGSVTVAICHVSTWGPCSARVRVGGLKTSKCEQLGSRRAPSRCALEISGKCG